MARGGKREGAGRKPGVPNGKTAAIAKAVADSGITPLDFLLSVLRDDDNELATRLDAARWAAPYVHPKRVPVDGDGRDAGLTVNVYTGVPRAAGD
jgi:hypothetical protein